MLKQDCRQDCAIMDGQYLGIIIMAYMLFLVQSGTKRDVKDSLHKNAAKDEAYCLRFFFGMPFPIMKHSGNLTGLIRLCQNQQHPNYLGPFTYATLYSIHDRIPVYSVAVLQLFPNCSGYSRPPDKLWKRAALELCDLDLKNLPEYSIQSRIGAVGLRSHACGMFQALDIDYEGNHDILGVDRGHLNPNAINCQDEETQAATFSLTNAAPQFSDFNEITWKHYECMVEVLLSEHVPSERVYVVTGTWDVAKDSEGNPLWMNAGSKSKNLVKVPGYYWKAVCYPGNPWKHSSPWGFAIIHQNSQHFTASSPKNFMTLEYFSKNYFEDDIFAKVCLDAKLGPIQTYFEYWNEVIDTKCNNQYITCSR